ncbi:MAG: bifunctional 5,10-methylenetetrahydrofolate dehydrogenase/5,10-methenyltetrahydrofolate cyclohydrolase [Lachnospiraceae bacterium]|nr:bifunctional 5,10-methylenetetrahydrofolate dehydrogenase/5,10-methenyltetrahydrofolate cyclohydrolase [Lachnospiraceae bacterium]
MAELLLGKNVTQHINDGIISDVEMLKGKGVNPTLGIIRVGENSSDIAYENGAVKRCEKLGVEYKKYLLPADAATDDVLRVIDEVNNDKNIHGVLLFRPLPKGLDAERIENALDPAKDVDCMTEASIGAVFTGKDRGYPPCTPQACMEILKFYGYDLKGKNVTVIGRSLVVGKPVAMMCMKENATVTICHTKTVNMQEISKKADIVIVAAGHAKTVGADFVSEGQTVIDVGINVDDEGNMCGDVDFAAVEPLVGAITPVPGGVGGVTTSVLLSHVVDAAKKMNP